MSPELYRRGRRPKTLSPLRAGGALGIGGDVLKEDHELFLAQGPASSDGPRPPVVAELRPHVAHQLLMGGGPVPAEGRLEAGLFPRAVEDDGQFEVTVPSQELGQVAYGAPLNRHVADPTPTGR